MIPRDEGGHEGKKDQYHGLVLVISTCFLVLKAAAQSDKYFENGTCRPILDGKEC
jgi:hypothetical protein